MCACVCLCVYVRVSVCECVSKNGRKREWQENQVVPKCERVWREVHETWEEGEVEREREKLIKQQKK